jgi:hypothetical protein
MCIASMSEQRSNKETYWNKKDVNGLNSLIQWKLQTELRKVLYCVLFVGSSHTARWPEKVKKIL